jgi:hypothetical protein
VLISGKHGYADVVDGVIPGVRDGECYGAGVCLGQCQGSHPYGWASLPVPWHSWLGSLVANMRGEEEIKGGGSLYDLRCPCRVVLRCHLVEVPSLPSTHHMHDPGSIVPYI